MKLINDLKWRYATKKFDTTKKVSEEDLNTIKEAIRLSPTSYGLQLLKVFVIEDKDTREKLKAAAWNQAQITDASHLLIFTAYSTVGDQDVDDYINIKAEASGANPEDFKGYADFMKNTISAQSDESTKIWTSKQTYITLGHALIAAAQLGIDACPMEGFDPQQVDEILGLKEKGLTSTVIAAIGYRAEDDSAAKAPKVRKSSKQLFEHI